MNPAASELIERLNLKPHPEGGYFRETYRSDEYVLGEHLPERYKQNTHSFSTSIYFLLVGSQISKLHRLASDEIWHYHSGGKAFIYIIGNSGALIKKQIGASVNEGDEPQVVIKKGSWFSAEVKDKTSYILVGCTVAPGFDFADFELAEREKLINIFPDLKEFISKFT